MTSYIAERFRAALAAAVVLSLLAGQVAWTVIQRMDRHERLDELANTAERRAIEIMSQTMNGSLMGSVSLLGLIDWELKREVRGETAPNMTSLVSTLESIGRAYAADGVFVVGGDGIVKSSWDNSGKPSTGIDVQFRPYYRMAMKGRDNVYAAVSLARGDRSMYFTAAVHAGTGRDDAPIGGIVARTGIAGIEGILRQGNEVALLLSPQGVVFASNRAEWVSRVAGELTPERLRAIRDVKQFGAVFEKSEPVALPLDLAMPFQTLDGRLHAQAGAAVRWNDPLGDWRIVLLEDLESTIPITANLWVGVVFAAGTFAMLLMLLNVMRSEHAQRMAGAQLHAYAQAREQAAADKARLAAASMRIQQCIALEELGTVFLTEAHDLVGMLRGVVYLSGDGPESDMTLLAAYGCPEAPPSAIAAGEGLLGQCAVEHDVRVIDRPSGDYWRIRSGLGEAVPGAGVILPVMLQEQFVGVVEVAMLRKPSDDDMELLREMTAVLAINAEIQRRNVRMVQMLSVAGSAEREKGEQLAFQQALIDAIPYPVFYKGPDSRFRGFNKAYEQAFNVRREDLIGRRVMDLEYLPEADRRVYQAEDEATIASGGTVQRPMKMPYADGSLKDTMYFVSGFRTGEGLPGGLVGTFIDLSGRPS